MLGLDVGQPKVIHKRASGKPRSVLDVLSANRNLYSSYSRIDLLTIMSNSEHLS